MKRSTINSSFRVASSIIALGFAIDYVRKTLYIEKINGYVNGMKATLDAVIENDEEKETNN